MLAIAILFISCFTLKNFYLFKSIIVIRYKPFIIEKSGWSNLHKSGPDELTKVPLSLNMELESVWKMPFE